MLCEVCKKNEATIHTIKIINGKTSEQHICKECAAKLSDTEFGDFGTISSNDIIKSFFNIKQPEVKSCPVCGYSFNDFKESGFLGCPECYNTFRKEIIPMLRRVHGNTKHVGTVPESSNEKTKLCQEINELKRRLAQAVNEENFEEAAKLRDRIAELKEEKNGAMA